MKVVVFGGLGNMGKRYNAVLRYLGHEPLIIDILDSDEDISLACMKCDAMIIATPTAYHVPHALKMQKYNKPILCEKPLFKGHTNLAKFKESMKAPLRMVDNYRFMEMYGQLDNNDTYYNFYNTGQDGIHWDCIQLYGLAEDKVTIENTSPFWQCIINGKHVAKVSVDSSYIEMLKDWLKKKDSNWDFIERAHAKVLEAIGGSVA